MEKHLFCDDIARTAIDLVIDKRARQLSEKGYTYDHDDQHSTEQLAAAAAFFLLPSWMNPDVCIADESGSLVVQPLMTVVAEGAWEDIFRDFGGDDPERYLDTRIDNVVRGLAIGLAELERLMRMREVADKEVL